jgi:hypothetical protein
MTAPTVIGGASTKGMEPTDTIQIPPFSGHGEPKRVLIDNKQVMNELHKVEYIRAEIHAINEDAIAALHRFEDPNLSLAQKREIGLDLSRLAEKKAALGSVEVQQGVLKEAEYWRALTKQVGFTGYSAEVPTSAGEAARELARLAQFAHATGSKSERERIVRFLQSQDTENYKQFTKAVESAGGREVKLGYTTDAQGFKHPVQTEVGRPFDASSIPAPKRPIQ